MPVKVIGADESRGGVPDVSSPFFLSPETRERFFKNIPRVGGRRFRSEERAHAYRETLATPTLSGTDARVYASDD